MSQRRNEAVGNEEIDRLEGVPQGFACRNVDDRFSKLIGVPRAFGVANHTGFLSGSSISSYEGTWVLSHYDSSAAPQTVQTASPVFGTKNFSSVRLYSAPQLH
jgi:hypothetical protein